MSMKKSPLKKTPDKLRKNSTVKALSQSQIKLSSSQVTSNLYFCHFKNAMYMGGIKAFQKNGIGILLHDNGTNLISSYYNDLLHGHNIFFNDHCLLSTEYYKNKLMQAVYRTDGFLLFTLYNQDGQLDGRCVLLNYITKNILYCVFKKGSMIQKSQQTQLVIINKVFDLGDLEFLIGKKHAKAICYSYQKQNNIIFQKIGQKLVIGYQKNGLINGLSFCYTIKSSNNNYTIQTQRNEDTFELTLMQRGYYINGQLYGFGEKIFKNGNSYIGQFKNDIFQGNGILKNSLKKNWVNGLFQKGNLVDLLEYNHQGGDKKYDRIIQSYHQKRSNWINNQITLINWNFFDQEIQKLITLIPNTQVKTLEQRKQQVLRKIQQNFICQSDLENNYSNLKEIQQISALKTNQTQNTQKQSVRKFVRNFIPQTENLSPPKYSPRSRQFGSKIMSSSRKRTTFFQQSRRSNNNNSFRKSRIFQSKGAPKKSADSLIKLQRVPQKQDSNQTTTKMKNSYDTGQKKNQSKSPSKYKDSQSFRKIFQANQSFTYNNNGSPRVQDSKKFIGKSRIFNNEEEDDDITPKFNYNETYRQPKNKINPQQQ